MNSPSNDEEDQGKVFLDESDIIQEITVDEEDLPDADEDAGSDAEVFDEADDSIHIFTGHTGELYTVVCSPTDTKLVATGGGDDKGFLWKIGQGDWAFELQGHKDSVSSLAFSTDGQLLASGSLDGLIQVWDVSAGNLKCTLEGPGGGIEWVRWHPRGHLVLAGSEDSTVWLWNADKNAYLNMFSGHASSVTCGKFTPDGKTICTGSDDATLRIWNPKNGENIHVVSGHPYHTEGLTCLAISSDSTLAITGSKDNSVHVVNITTGKVFSILDTQSLCYAAAACSFFRKCALDPLCYASIDLMTVVPKVNNLVVSTMIQRAGKALRSIKLGLVPGPTTSLGSSQPLVYSMRNSTDVSGFSWNDKRSRQGRESSILSRSCLNSLSLDTGAPGAMLRRLHLYNIERLDNTALSAALSVCPSLLDLEIVGLHVELRQTLESVSKYCHLIERLFFESSKTGRDDSLKLSPTCSDLVHNCPNLNSLALRGFKLQDFKVLALVKGFRKLKYLDFSTSYSITGVFLKKLSGGSGGNLLEVLILRDCMHLKKAEVERFISAVLAGDFKFLRHLDISNREGLASEDDWYSRCYSPSFIPIKKLYEERPGFCLLAEFPLEGSFIEVEQMISSDVDVSLPSQLSSPTSDGSFFMDTSESSYNSDQGSGNEDSRDTSFVGYEESSDEVDFLSV